MPTGDLRRANFGAAFSFVREAAATYRNASGALATAGVNKARFDHAADGTAFGLLLSAGEDLGTRDRVRIRASVLPDALLDTVTPGARDVTILHRYAAPVADEADRVEVRHAWYSRNVKAAIDALLMQAGHHLEIGVLAGFRPNYSGVVRFRGHTWALAGVLMAGSAALHDGHGRPLIVSGAQANL